MINKSRKKIALLHYAYPPKTGGVESLIYQQANFLNKNDYNITILTGEGKETNSQIRLIKIQELKAIISQDPNLQKKILDKGIIDGEFYHLADLIEKKIAYYLDSTDIIIVHNMMTLSWNLAFTFAFSQYAKTHPGKKIFIWVHDHMLVSTKGIENTYHPSSQLEKELLTTPIKNATYILVSNIFKKYFSELMNLPNHKCLVVPNGIPTPEFLNIEETIWKFIQEKQLMSSLPIIFSPVNLVERKNIEYSIELLSYLKTSHPNAVYLISGHPSIHRDTQSYVDFLKEKISKLGVTKNTIFLWDIFQRTLTNAEIRSLYRLVDIIFYFSKSENFGLPILESALSKTPIITSNLDVFHEIADPNLTFVDVKSASAKEAASKIANIIDNNSLIQLNYKVRKNYDLDTILEHHLLPILNRSTK